MAPSQAFSIHGGVIMDVKSMLDLLKLTRGRIAPRDVFCDFIKMAAHRLSFPFDPVHREERAGVPKEVLKKFTKPERVQLEEGLRDMARHYERVVDQGIVDDLLSWVYQELGMTGKHGIEYTPGDVATLQAKMAFMGQKPALPETGYFTIDDSACGSGNLFLFTAKELMDAGFNLCRHVVMQGTDISINSVYMSYLQLSFHAIPAVIIHGNTLTLEEYDRWYTPTYILGKWVWRCPMPFGTQRSMSDELLKMADEPTYGIIRQMEWGLWPLSAETRAAAMNTTEN